MADTTRAATVGPPVEAGPRTTFTGTIKLKLRVPARLRNLELVLLLFACLINGAAVVLVQLGAVGEIRQDVIVLGGGLAVLALGMHIALRIVAPDADPFILPVAIVLNGLGIAEIYRLDLAAKHNGWEAAGVRQIAWTAIAMVIALVRSRYGRVCSSDGLPPTHSVP